MKSLLRPVFSFACLWFLASSALAADISGQWRAEFDTMIGVQKYVFEFKVDGEKLTGKAIGERDGEKAEVVLVEGRISGNEVSFVENLNFQGMPLRIAYQGTVTNENEIKLTRQVGDVAAETLVARRVHE